MPHLIRCGTWSINLSNEAFREICSVAYDHGWRPLLPEGWQCTLFDNHDALHWQMECGLKALTVDETSALSVALHHALADKDLRVGKEADNNFIYAGNYPYLSRALIAEIAEHTASGVLEILT